MPARHLRVLGYATLTLTLTLTAACGGPSASLQVNPKVVSQFPPEARMWVYDAENEIIIALDNRDAARAKVLVAERDIERARTAAAAAAKRAGADAPARARVAWHEARRDHAAALVDAADVNIICARANMELTKAKLVVRFDVLGEDKKFSVKSFERQQEKCARELVSMHQKADKLRDRAKKAEAEWRKTRQDYISRTGDHDHGLWID
ncbi:MAG TPA: hypothetical protein VGQ83_01150 [Polyangia bacterium]|jgi:hypothetical protein